MRMRLLTLTTVTIWLAASPCFADDGAVIDRWYAALLLADRAGLSDLLADNARIRLDDIGIEQSKQEFLGSMDEWQASVKGAAIRHRVEKIENGISSVVACYDFPGNDLMMQETFAISGDVITASSQVTIAENCDSF